MSPPTETKLYPEIIPYATHTLPVGQGHTLYVEECGSPAGLPIVFLHGGPGAYCKPYHRSLFNPEIYRIILFDQRGAGQSTPTGSLAQNTTWDLVADIEKIRTYLGIENWVIYGGSWGATLGLLYAQTHSERVLGIILRSPFLARERDVHWFYSEGGVSRLFPAQWQTFMRFLPQGHWDNPLAIYYDRLVKGDTQAAQAAALAWVNWEGCIISFGQWAPLTACSPTLLDETRLECHYAFHHYFIEDNRLLDHIDKVADVPAILLHGQQDLVCPLEGAYTLEQAWPAAQLKILPTSGHLTSESNMLAAVIAATDEMAKWITP